MMAKRSLTERRFTDCARVIVEQAVRRASDRGLLHVDRSSYAVLLLWTLIRWERKLGFAALEMMGVDLERLAREVDGILRRRAEERPVVFNSRTNGFVYKESGETYTGWDYDAIAHPLFDRAEHEAREMSHDYIGSEHLLLAIISEADPELKRVLDDHLMSVEGVRETILEILKH